MKKLVVMILIFLVVGLWGAPAAIAAELAQRVKEHRFANGMTLLFVHRDASPTFTAYITLGVGSVDETSRTRGVAHLLEHMLFKGTRTHGTLDFVREQPLLDEIERIGSQIDSLKVRPGIDPEPLVELRTELARLQQLHKELVVKDEFSAIYAENGGTGFNAFTSKDLTTYLISLPSNKLELWALLESDRMRSPVLREFYTERDVVQEERRRSYDSNPDGLLYENLLATAFKVHPYRNPIIGWHSDIESLTIRETRDFLHAYYAPVNTVIALVGDLDFERSVEMMERYFGDIPPGVPVPPVSDVEPAQLGEKRLTIRFDAEPRVAMAWHKPTLPEKDDYVFDLIDIILSGGRTSRLYKSLVLERRLAVGVSTYGAPGARYPNLFVVSATPRHPHSLSEVEAAITEELERLKTEPVSQQELERAINQLRFDRLERLRSNEGLASMLTYYQSVAGDWRYLVTYDEQVANLSAEDIMAAARKYFTDSNKTLVRLQREEVGDEAR